MRRPVLESDQQKGRRLSFKKELNRFNSLITYDEDKKELTEAENKRRLRKEMEDHYNAQISKLYS